MSNQAENKFNQVKGTVKEKTGKATNNKKMENEGKAEKTAGKVNEKFDDITGKNKL